MRVVFALSANTVDGNTVASIGQRDFLASWVHKNGLLDYAMTLNPDMFIVDSGAFSAWTLGKHIDFDAYRVHAHNATTRHPRTHIVNLDVIPGEYGRTSTAAERAEGMEQSLHHADVLRADGFRVMEVFHQDEPAHFLAHLLTRRQPNELLGLSPRNDVATPMKCRWLREVHKEIRAHTDTMPPCHGLAVTGGAVFRAFPFYSVDSSSWMAPTRWGLIVGTDGKMKKMRHVYGNGNGQLSRQIPEQRAVLEAAVRTTCRTYQKMARDTTAYWATKGIVWNEAIYA